MQKLFTCLYGSRLYGTQTPTSDLDVKHIVLPPLDHLLLGKQAVNKVKKTNTEKNTRNSADDVDEEFIPIQVFAYHFYEGQTYALELAFALEGTHAEQAFYDRVYGGDGVGQDVPLTNLDLGYYGLDGAHAHKKLASAIPNGIKFLVFARELREKFLTSNIKAMMGYAVNQASLYSMKGERLKCVQLVHFLMNHVDEYYGNAGDDPSDWPLSQVYSIPYFNAKFKELAEQFPKYFRIGEYDIGGGVMRPCFFLLEKHLPFTNTYEHSMRVLGALEKKYGDRSKSATADCVDWKATMHALRIVDEGLQLLRSKKLSFPFAPDYVELLLSIKRGEVPIEQVTELLNDKLEELKDLELSSTLAPSSPERRAELDTWLAGWMHKFYNV